MALRGESKYEKAATWRSESQAELTRLGSLPEAQLGAEVMRRGFGDLPAGGERTRIGLANSLCPEAPAAVGGDDIGVVQQYNELLVPVLSALEAAGLLLGEERGRSALRFYRVTDLGRGALTEHSTGTILTAQTS